MMKLFYCRNPYEKKLALKKARFHLEKLFPGILLDERCNRQINAKFATIIAGKFDFISLIFLSHHCKIFQYSCIHVMFSLIIQKYSKISSAFLEVIFCEQFSAILISLRTTVYKCYVLSYDQRKHNLKTEKHCNNTVNDQSTFHALVPPQIAFSPL